MNPKQETFCQEYLKDLNAAGAYARAGYKTKGHAAAASAYKLLMNADIQARIQELQAERAQRCQVDADRVLKEMALVAFSRLGKLIDLNDPSFAFRLDADESAQAALAGIKVRYEQGTENKPAAQVVEFKIHPKVEALTKLMQHLGLLKDTVQIEADVRQRVVEEVVDGPEGSTHRNKDNPPAPGSADVPPSA